MMSFRLSLMSTSRGGVLKAVALRAVVCIAMGAAAFSSVEAASTALPSAFAGTTSHERATALLPDGGIVVVDGSGVRLGSDEQSAKPVDGVAGRRFATATVLASGEVLIWGGLDAQGNVVAQGVVIDPKINAVRTANVPLASRAGHSLTVLTDGRVLMAGGWSSADGWNASAELWDPRSGTMQSVTKASTPSATEAELVSSGHVVVRSTESSDAATDFDPTLNKFIPLPDAAKSKNGEQLRLAGSSPENNSAHVALDQWVGLRFAQLMDRASLNAQTVTLIGPNGPTAVDVSAAEGGRLAFVRPVRDLLPASQYTLFVANAKAASGEVLPFTTVHFTTASFAAISNAASSSASSSGGGNSSENPRATSGSTNATTAPLVTLKLSTGSADGVKAEKALCKSKQNVRGYHFCNDAGQIVDGIFKPGFDNTSAHWRLNKPLPKVLSVGDLPNGLVAPGTTAVFGTVRRIDDQLLSRVTVMLGSLHTQTDENGFFLLKNVPAGHQVLVVDGSSANTATAEYGQFLVAVEVQDKQANAVPFNLFMPRITAQDKVTIPSPTTMETVITHPAMPGFEYHIPAGVVFRDRNGKVLTQLAFVPMPVDRSPVPVPGNFPLYYSAQPSGATIEGLTETSATGIRVVYPNYSMEEKKGSVFWYYDVDHGGWTIYGNGQVSADKKSLLLHAHIGETRIMPDGAESGGATPGEKLKCEPPLPPLIPLPNYRGDPVECHTGVFQHKTMELAAQDVQGGEFLRTYSSKDPIRREFGVGNTHNFGMYLYIPDQVCTGYSTSVEEYDVVTPNGGFYAFMNTHGPGLPTWQNSVGSSSFFGATLQLSSSEQMVLRTPGGTQYIFNNGCPTKLSTIIDRFGNGTRLTYNAGLLSEVAFSSGRALTFSYNGQGFISQVADNTGRSVSYTYNGNYELQSAQYPDGTTEQYTYDTNGNMLTVVDRRGHTMVTNHYDANQRVDVQTYADSTTYHFAYTLSGGVVTATDITDENGHVEHTVWDAQGYATSVTRAYGTSNAQTTSYVRNAAELITSATDALSRTTAFTYDNLGGMLTRTSLYGTSDAVTYTYTYTPDFHQVASVQDPLGHTTTYGYTAGCPTSTTDALGHSTSATCNGSGQATSITDALGHTTSFGYSGSDLVTVTDAMSHTTNFSVDALGHVTSTTDPLGRQTRAQYDSLGRVTQSTDALNQTTTYQYDSNGNLTSVTDPAGGVTQYGYDSRNHRISRTDALNHSESWTYDNVGNVLTYTDRKGQVTQYQYDELNRPTLITYDDSSTITPTYDAGNRLVSVVDSVSGEIDRSYDGMDRLLEEDTVQGTVSYTYDAAGNRVSMRAPVALVPCLPSPCPPPIQTYTYDAANRLTEMDRADLGESLFFGYDVAGRRTSTTLPNGIVTSYGYDNANELTGLTYTKGATNVGSIGYTYDAAGQRVSRTGGFATDLLPTPSTGTNTFDLANKQTVWNGFNISYDLNGDPTSDASVNPSTITYTFDARHRLVEIDQGTTITVVVATFTYDAFNRRITKVVNDNETDYVYDGLNPVSEIASDGTVVNVLNGLGVDERYARDDYGLGARAYFLSDALGSTVALTDGSGAVQQTYGYEPYGEVSATGSSDNPYQYRGRENDGTGLYYYKARYYSPSLKRFISEDPAGLDGGLNAYAYVSNNPIDFFDPDGEARQHKKNARKSTQQTHEQGQARKRMDSHGGEKGDARRWCPSKRPPGTKGPWPRPPPSKLPRGFIMFGELIGGAADAALLALWPSELGCDTLDGCGDDDPSPDPVYYIPPPPEDDCGCNE